jgi:hypothetical protein
MLLVTLMTVAVVSTTVAAITFAYAVRKGPNRRPLALITVEREAFIDQAAPAPAHA